MMLQIGISDPALQRELGAIRNPTLAAFNDKIEGYEQARRTTNNTAFGFSSRCLSLCLIPIFPMAGVNGTAVSLCTPSICPSRSSCPLPSQSLTNLQPGQSPSLTVAHWFPLQSITSPSPSSARPASTLSQDDSTPLCPASTVRDFNRNSSSRRLLLGSVHDPIIRFDILFRICCFHSIYAFFS